MKKISVALACCAWLLLSVSCKKSPTDDSSETILGSGTLVTEVCSLAFFHSVELRTVGNVNITHGAVQEVSVTIDDNIL